MLIIDKINKSQEKILDNGLDNDFMVKGTMLTLLRQFLPISSLLFPDSCNPNFSLKDSSIL